MRRFSSFSILMMLMLSGSALRCSPSMMLPADNVNDNTMSAGNENANDNQTGAGNVNDNSGTGGNANDNSQSGANENGNDNTGPDPLGCNPPCVVGQSCENGVCVTLEGPQAEFGYTDDADSYRALVDEDTMPFFTFGQGGSHMFVTVRVTGFTMPEDSLLDVTYIMFNKADNSALAGFEESAFFTDVGGGVFEAKRRPVFISEFPQILDGQVGEVTVKVESSADASQVVRVTRTLNMSFDPE